MASCYSSCTCSLPTRETPPVTVCLLMPVGGITLIIIDACGWYHARARLCKPPRRLAGTWICRSSRSVQPGTVASLPPRPQQMALMCNKLKKALRSLWNILKQHKLADAEVPYTDRTTLSMRIRSMFVRLQAISVHPTAAMLPPEVGKLGRQCLQSIAQNHPRIDQHAAYIAPTRVCN